MAAAGRRGRQPAAAAGPLTVSAALAGSGLPRIEAEILLCHAAGQDRTWLYAHGSDPLAPAVAATYAKFVARRQAGEPIAYLIGRREFWNLQLEVGPAVLIPRPETELLVEAALARCPDARQIVDLGTGSGAIALALANELPAAHVVATDASEEALAVARVNARINDIANIEFRHGRWFEALDPGERFDLIVSNPPYIADADPHLARGDLRFEPRGALAAGPEGLDDLTAIIAGAPAHLAPGGWLLFEHGHDQQDRVAALLDAGGWQVERLVDLASQPRALAARRR